MSQFTIVWDVLMTGEAVMEKKAAVSLALEMESYASGIEFQTVQRWNYVATGKKISQAGFTNGLRFTSLCASLEHIKTSISHLEGFVSPLAQSSKARVAETVAFPLERATKQRLPSVGRMALKTTFTHGMGLTEHKKIQNAKSDQTRMTKDGLDPTRVGKNSSAAWFSDEFRSLMSNSNWFLVLPTHGSLPSSVLKSGADGGVYEFSFNLEPAIEELSRLSEGIWWDKLEEHEASNLHPTLLFNPTEELDSPFDPVRYPHFEETKPRIDNVKNFEEQQTGDSGMVEELTYTLGRMTRGRRISKQATSDDGLVSGMEDFVVKTKFIKPMVCEEFFNAMGFFVMTRNPKFWRNGSSEVMFFHDDDSLKMID